MGVRARASGLDALIKMLGLQRARGEGGAQRAQAPTGLAAPNFDRGRNFWLLRGRWEAGRPFGAKL